MMPCVRLALSTVLLVAALAACSAAQPAVTQPAVTTPAPTTPAPTTAAPVKSTPGRASLRFTEIAQFDKPVAFAVRKGDESLYIAEQGGTLRAVRAGKVVKDPIVDLSQEVSGGNEQGLLGVAFHPTGRWLYLDWTDRAGHTHVTEWAFDGKEATARRDVLTQNQPYANHNGGQLAFGPDGYLYIAFGDGGSGGDPQGNGQNLGTWLGKVLRIDPRGEPYKVPKDNPFIGKNGAKREIWAYGLRNPWRFTFDRQTGDLWIGDVGQNAWEEVDYQPAGSQGGENYGWNLREGAEPFEGGKGGELTEPVITYPLGKDGNCSVIAGFVYRGTAIPWLEGRFLYGDFCAGWIKEAPVDELETATQVGTIEQVSSFGQDAAGELYVLSLQGAVYRIEAG